jgi:XTP/dITP diphosphohydrolase
MKHLLIATRNLGKLHEYSMIFAGLDIKLHTLQDLGIDEEVDETGTTFAYNAELKARAYLQLSGMPTLADDSGLEVAALNGEPGVYSARYGGLTGAAQLDYLLQKMEGVPFHQRLARFVCVIVLAHPDGRMEFAEGTLAGVIDHEPRGTGGFGYDSIFYVLDEHKTLAELTLEQKNAISHRAMATQEARKILDRWQTESWKEKQETFTERVELLTEGERMHGNAKDGIHLVQW